MRSTIMILFLSLAFTGVQPAAADNFTAADYLVEIGEYDLRHNNVESAVHEFSKALMIDPTHKQAREYLRKYGMPYGMYSKPNTPTNTVGHLARTVKSQRDILAMRELKQKEMDMELAKVKAHRDHLSRELTQKNLKLYEMKKNLNNLEYRSRKFDKQVKQIERVYQEHAAALEMEMLFSDDKVELSAEELGMIHAYENELIALQEEYNDYRETHFMDKVKREAAYTAMTDYVLVRSRAVDDLRDTVLYKDMDIAEKERALIMRMDELHRSLEDVKHLRASVDMKDAFLEEKQKEIMKLKKELNQLNKEAAVKMRNTYKGDARMSALISEMDRIRAIHM